MPVKLTKKLLANKCKSKRVREGQPLSQRNWATGQTQGPPQVECSSDDSSDLSPRANTIHSVYDSYLSRLSRAI